MKKVKLIKNNLYEIEWVDTFGYSGWFFEGDIDERIKTEKEILSSGYFIKATKDFLILASSYNRNKDFATYANPRWIPKGFVKSIRKLGV